MTNPTKTANPCTQPSTSSPSSPSPGGSSESSSKADIKAAELLPCPFDELKALFLEAAEHLDYCGYGDKWERECADDTRLRDRVAAMVLLLDPPQPEPAPVDWLRPSPEELARRKRQSEAAKHRNAMEKLKVKV